VSRWARRAHKRGVSEARARLLSGLGWGLALLGVIGFAANELASDLPPVHYAMYGVIFAGGYLGLRFLR